MSETVIAVKDLSKRYLIEHTPDAQGYKRYTALRDVIGDEVGNFARKVLATARRQVFHPREVEEFWALKDVSFEVKQGEVLGIIGRNGAGKSTLLKILSRITEPTAGRVTLRGRVASLLEVGTGFHPELTGRENIYLNGAILGMSRAEIRRKFDEIVAFAEVEKFLLTPVKRYSSGMYVRLAFAVAAHLEPEILVIDEVLAVGDAEFQQKCLGKMSDVARESRTVLFVSHNMGAIRSLCSRGIVLDHGTVVADTDVSASIELYHRLASTASGTSRRSGIALPRLVSHEGRIIRQGDPFEVATTLRIESDAPGFSMWCFLDDMYQRRIAFGRYDSMSGARESWRGAHEIRVKWPGLWLEPGLYAMHFRARLRGSNNAAQRHVSDVLHLDVAGASSGHNSVLSPQAEWGVEAA